MKKTWTRLRLVASGFLIAMVLHICINCEKNDDNGNNIDSGITLDIKGMEKGGDDAELAFLSGDPVQVIELLSDDSKSYFEKQLSDISPSVLISLGEALKNREHTVKSSTYTEFEFSDQGVTYTIALGLDEDLSWKIIRF
ncbi:hypothetical protein ACFLSY_03045 [Bacteroidota bacterium]